MNPIPDLRIDAEYFRSGHYGNASTRNIPEFRPPCKGAAGPDVNQPGNGAQGMLCAGQATGLQIIDYVRVPAGLASGDYVLGWRWDCEATAQVWSACADITVRGAP